MKKLSALCFIYNRFVVLCLVSYISFGQDAQFTQFYATPLYLNPAFAGSTQQARAIVAYRNQWAQLDANFVTTLASYDHYLERYNISLGFLARNDQQGIRSSTLQNNEISAIGGYYVAFNKKYQMSFGLQIGMVSRNLNYSNLLFARQFNSLTNQFDKNMPSGESFASERVNFADFSTGTVFYSHNFWIGFSAHHLTQPNQSFLSLTDRLPLKGSLHGGYVLALHKKTIFHPSIRRYLIPAFHYKFQGQSDQMSLGAYAIIQPVLVGMWYRGIPLKRYHKTFINQDAISFCLGYQTGALKVAYSYDITISELARYGASSHEITLSYQIEVNHSYGKKGAKNMLKKTIPSPWQMLSAPRMW
ncbi:MAG: type IX secretion system membrane protein PorP/SprF [Cytophagales bacterium]|nr:type IX secretion system membrane protein PorP/SprF [Cytophagales bacterium]MDW8383362.1 type IX secretion system membrane protein PorP/SprF [Flammeovirgaceae bacterium]